MNKVLIQHSYFAQHEQNILLTDLLFDNTKQAIHPK